MRKKTYNDYLKPEEKFQARLVSWIEDHPILRHKLFFHVPAAQERSEYEKYKWKALGCKKSLPDLIFIEPEGGYNGLVVELKVTFPYKKDGSCKFPAQEAMLNEFKKRGFAAVFGWDYKQAKETIEKYFDL